MDKNIRNISIQLSSLVSMIRFVWFTWKRRGLTYSLRIAFAELYFEYRYNIDTISMRLVSQITDVTDKDKEDSGSYQATHVYSFKKMFNHLEGVHSSSGSFLDLGSGKGRAMMLGALHGFRKIYGVEYSLDLCQVAEINISKFRKNLNAETEFLVINDNVLNYEIPSDVSVIYMANPFGNIIMSSILDRVEQSLINEPREIVIVYLNPLCRNLMLQRNYEILLEGRDPKGSLSYEVYMVTV